VSALTTVVVVFVYANLVEYLYHRFPMHSWWGCFIRRQHFFHHQASVGAIAEEDDLRLALTPALLAIYALHTFGFAAVAPLLGYGVALAGWLTVTFYLVFLDVCHWWQHTAAIPRNRFLRAVQLWHLQHHWYDTDPQYGYDRSRKFNIFFPLWDAVFGTWR